MISRRKISIYPLLGLPFLANCAPKDQAGTPPPAPTVSGENAKKMAQIEATLANLEAETGGRLGFGLSYRGQIYGHRIDEIFGMCSTFKLPLVGLVLREIELGNLAADEALPLMESDIIYHHPISGQYLTQGFVPVMVAAAAAQMQSDNVAANLLLKRLGGPDVVTAKWRAAGLQTIRIDRFEPDMNFAPPGEVRDTCSPRAGIAMMDHYLTSGLNVQHRALLLGWMADTQTGLRRIRAALPAQWWAGDKTGTADRPEMANKVNDLAIVRLPNGERIYVAAYNEADKFYEGTQAADEARIKEATRQTLSILGLI